MKKRRNNAAHLSGALEKREPRRLKKISCAATQKRGEAKTANNVTCVFNAGQQARTDRPQGAGSVAAHAQQSRSSIRQDR
jgi:hypothetical protein